MFKLSEINDVAQRSFFNQITNTGALLQTNWTSNVNDVGFAPDYAIIRSIIYNTDTMADQQIYTITSSLNNHQSIASFPGSNVAAATSIMPIISNPQKLIKLKEQSLNSINFSLFTYATDGTNKLATTSGIAAGIASSILIEIDFIKLKPKTKI